MRADITYDGKIMERNLEVLERLSSVTSDISSRICSVQRKLESKKSNIDYILENDIKVHGYFDVCLSGTIFEFVGVGEYGFSVFRYDRELSIEGCPKVKRINTISELKNIRNPIFRKVGARYESTLRWLLDVPSTSTVMGAGITIDSDKFVKSDLWKKLKEYRDRQNINSSLVYKVSDVIEYLQLLPDDIITSSVIPVEHQRFIIKIWKEFLLI